jgi:thiamine transporter ThiT
MKGSASKLLRAYMFFTAIAIILSLVPLMSGQDAGKVNAICQTLCIISFGSKTRDFFSQFCMQSRVMFCTESEVTAYYTAL